MSRLLTIVSFLFLGCNNTTGQFDFEKSLGISSGTLVNSSTPIEATKYVSFHPDRLLRMNAKCTQILRFNLVQKKNYADILTELKNRAALMGNIFVSILGWRENDLRTVLLANDFICRDKMYNIHPHPK